MRHILLFFVTGCSTVKPLPEKFESTAQLRGFHDIRDFANKPSGIMQRDLNLHFKQFIQHHSNLASKRKVDIDVLAISGGGSYGAYTVSKLVEHRV